MHDLAATEEKLRVTPTAGVAPEHSAIYGDLVSKGYKGHVQGALAGATLYGGIGLAVGALVGIPLMLFPPAGLASLLLIPALGCVGALHGAQTFSEIGTIAAISAESLEINEKRRTLLDRLNETDNPLEKKEILTQLAEQQRPKIPEKVFHWKTVLVGAAMGMALALGVMYLAPAMLPEMLGGLVVKLGIATGTAGALTMSPIAGLVAGAIGALGGGIIGLDREYVRRWLATSETLISEPSHVQQGLAEREHELQLLRTAAERGTAPAAAATSPVSCAAPSMATNAPDMRSTTAVPTNAISDIAQHQRMMPQQQLAHA